MAFIAYSESVIYQGKILPEKKLRMFLWWNKSYPKEYLFELDMCIHVFGGTSFLSYSNYAPSHTTADNEKQFGLFIHSSIIQMLRKDNFSWEEKIA